MICPNCGNLDHTKCTCLGDFCCHAGKSIVNRILRGKMKPKIYIASGWFNEKQMEQMKEVYRVLIDFKLKGEIDLFAPYYDGIVLIGIPTIWLDLYKTDTKLVLDKDNLSIKFNSLLEAYEEIKKGCTDVK